MEETGMAEQRSDIRQYDGPAGGWDALKAVTDVLAGQDVVVSGAKALLSMNQPDGFDCPGCAWPDPKQTSRFEFCENGAKALAWESTTRRCTPEFFAAHSVTELMGWTDHDLENEGRLTHPMVYDAGTDHYRPISWDDAFATIGRHLRALPNPNMAEFYTSGRTANETAFLYQIFVREYGTNNFPDCSNMCHEATSKGLPHSLGVGKGTVLLEDFELADAIFIFGQNPGTNSPRMMTALHDAARRGARIVSFNPLRERALERFQAPQNPVEMATLTSTPISSRILQLRVGGDAAAIKGLMKALLGLDAVALAERRPAVLDHDFIREHTNGFEALAADLLATPWEAIERKSGLSRADLEWAACIYAGAPSAILAFGMGLTQHRRGANTVQQVANLALLRGNIGRPGAGVCPVRGHSNVQGDRTVGIDEQPSPELLTRIQARFGFAPPREDGHNTVTALQAIIAGESRVFIGMGGNFVSAVPDWGVVWPAFRQLALTAHVSTKLNRSHLVHGREALILPCLARSEIDLQGGVKQRITVEDSMSMVHASGGINTPASPDLLSEPVIVARMARATLGQDSRVDWEAMVADYERIRDAIEDVFPIFQGFNARIREPGGFHLGSSARDRAWATPSGRCEFLVFEGLDEDEHEEDPTILWLTTLRSHDQYNTTIYSNSDRYRGVHGTRDVVFLNSNEIAARGLLARGRVDLTTVSTDGVQRTVRNLEIVATEMPDRCIAAYYPETNPLMPLYAHDPESFCPAYKAVPVRIAPTAVP